MDTLWIETLFGAHGDLDAAISQLRLAKEGGLEFEIFGDRFKN